MPPLLSGSCDADLEANLARVDTGAFAFHRPTRVEDEQRGSQRWHEDFLLRDRAWHHATWPGDVVHFCGPSFNWAQVLPLLEGVNASRAVRLDAEVLRAQGGVGTVHLVAGSKAQTKAGFALAEADTLAVCLLVSSGMNDEPLWSSLADAALGADWVPVAEWVDGEGGVRALLVRPAHADFHSRLSLLSGAPWTLLAGRRVEERSLGVDAVFGVLLEEAPPKVTRWSDLVVWLLLPSTYSAVRRRQASNLSALQCWWSRTWRVCPHERVRVLTAQSCQLCGDPGHGLGCSECSTHVCLPCHRLAEAGCPGALALGGRCLGGRSASAKRLKWQPR